MMISLTLDEANEVKGHNDPMHALHPIALKDGTYVLPVAVLDDPFHAPDHELLNTLPIIADPLPEDYENYEPPGATGATGA
jgi:hypothetical protein